MPLDGCRQRKRGPKIFESHIHDMCVPYSWVFIISWLVLTKVNLRIKFEVANITHSKDKKWWNQNDKE